MDMHVRGTPRDRYPDFGTLAANETEGVDFRIHVEARPHSPVAVIAPHGGSIERRTSAIARAIARDDFNLYLFEGLDADGSFDTLHITSHRFDEPSCLELVAVSDTVVAVHGCGGSAPRVMLGGRDRALAREFGSALAANGVDVALSDHRYPGTHSRNICNRGRAGRGVQIEMTDGLRGGSDEPAAVDAIRNVLLALG